MKSKGEKARRRRKRRRSDKENEIIMNKRVRRIKNRQWVTFQGKEKLEKDN